MKTETRDQLAVGGLLLGTVLQAIDGSIVNVAVPQIERALSAPLPEVSWAVTAYVLASLVSMPMASSLARRFGARAFFSGSVALFMASSAAAGFAPTVRWLIAFRVVQGIAAGGLLPLAQGTLMALYTGPRRAKAIALIGVCAVLGPLFGPPLGGVLTEWFGWSSIFFINLPLGALSLVLVSGLRVDADGAGDGGIDMSPIDVYGCALLAVALTCVQLAFAYSLLALWPAGVALVLLVRHERVATDPIVNLDVLQHRSLTGTLLAAPIYGAALYGSIFATPWLLQERLGTGAGASGLILAISGVTSGAAILSARPLLSRFRALALCSTGALLFTLAMLWLGWVSYEGRGAVLLPQALRGAGTGLLYVGMNGYAFETLSAAELVGASGLFYMLRQLGGSVGVALCAMALSTKGGGGATWVWAALAGAAPIALLPLTLSGPRRPS